MYTRSTFFGLLILVAFSGCSSNTFIAPNICLKEMSQVSEVEITVDHLKYFSENSQLMDAGHYLSGVYASGDGEYIYTSVYEGNKLDSLLNADSFASQDKKPLGERMFWFDTSNKLFLFSSERLVLIDFPPSMASKIIPDQGNSDFFQLCD